jgi:hypothetical protein
MKLHVLSRRNLDSSVSLDPVYALEDLMAEVGGGSVWAPRARWLYRVAAPAHRPPVRGLRGLVRRTVGAYEALALPPKTGPELLVVIGIAAPDLQLVEAVPDFRRRFDLVVGYVFDAWSHYPAFLHAFDRIFVPLPDELGEWPRRLGVPATLLPFGVDALGEGGDGAERPIDLLSYGRIPGELCRVLSGRFNHAGSRRLFLRTVPRPRQQYPGAPYPRRDDGPDTALLYHLLRRAKASLCLDTLYPGMRRFPYSFVTLRWFDAFATGCVAVGRRPGTPEADRLMPWPESTVDLPADPHAAVDQLEVLLDDARRLERIRLRNAYHALAAHDWRHRLRDLYRTLDLDLPAALDRGLEQLDARARQAHAKAAAVGAV